MATPRSVLLLHHVLLVAAEMKKKTPIGTGADDFCYLKNADRALVALSVA